LHDALNLGSTNVNTSRSSDPADSAGDLSHDVDHERILLIALALAFPCAGFNHGNHGMTRKGKT
jgi:hypothetical protein